MKLSDDLGRKQIVDNVFLVNSYGEGWSIIVCRFVEMDDVIEYLHHITGWEIEKHNNGDFTLHKGNDAISVWSWTLYRENVIKTGFQNLFDTVLVII